ncbi:helix-turn-helix domain-containing protein [bacterium]|nr:helix-turn-helix domain-containing protein [bacterium]
MKTRKIRYTADKLKGTTNMLIRTYKYRIYPTKTQQTLLGKIIQESRSLPPETTSGMTLGTRGINVCGVEGIPFDFEAGSFTPLGTK